MTVPALELTQFTVTEPAPGYWRATFDHPPTNLMNAVTAAELRAIVEAAEEAGDLRVLVLDSASDEYFFARYDLSAGPLPSDPGPTGLPIFLDTTVRLSLLPAISIAQIRGRARGGGNELALACDLRYAALETAVLGQPEIGSALVPAGGGLERLVPLVGRSRALEMLRARASCPRLSACARRRGAWARTSTWTWASTSGQPTRTRAPDHATFGS